MRMLLCCILASLTTIALRAQTVELADTSGERGQIVAQPLYGALPEGAQSLKVRLRYTYQLLAWRGTLPAEGYAVQCVLPKVLSQTVDMDAGWAELTIRCDSLQNAAGGIALLQWEILAGRDSVALVEVLSVEVDQQPLSISKAQGQIVVLSPPVLPVEGDALEIVGENPLPYRLKVRYRLVEPSTVIFKVFAMNGKKILERDLGRQEARMYLRENFEFPEVYPSGIYFLVMETERGAYVLPFTLVR